jgi:hypothetical protein
MKYSGMLRRVALVRIDVSEECSASIIQVTIIGDLTSTLELTGNRLKHIVFLRSERRLLVTDDVPSSPILVTLIMEELRSSETLILTRATRLNIPEVGILHSHCREQLKSYIRKICSDRRLTNSVLGMKYSLTSLPI